MIARHHAIDVNSLSIKFDLSFSINWIVILRNWHISSTIFIRNQIQEKYIYNLQDFTSYNIDHWETDFHNLTVVIFANFRNIDRCQLFTLTKRSSISTFCHDCWLIVTTECISIIVHDTLQIICSILIQNITIPLKSIKVVFLKIWSTSSSSLSDRQVYESCIETYQSTLNIVVIHLNVWITIWTWLFMIET